jgi:glutamine amidotransferase
MKKKICIIDLGTGNVASVANTLKHMNHEFKISINKIDLNNSSHIILPGVGSYKNFMKKINTKNIINILKENVIHKGKPFLGICVGMQVLSEYGFEFEKTKGLSWIRGNVKKIKVKNKLLPHIGWNSIDIKKSNHPLFYNLNDKSNFYFVNSYQFQPKNKENILATTMYEKEFCSIISKNNIFGTQFHPEKSQKVGLQFINNFINLKC